MKKTPLILSIAAFLIAAAALIITLAGPKKCNKQAATEGETITAAAGDIVYVRIDSLMVQYDMFNDLRSEFEAKAQGVQDELTKKGRKLENDGKAFENQINKGLLTRSSAEKQQQSLLQRQQDLQQLANEKQLELQEEEAVMMNRIMDAVKTFLEEYNAEHNFAAILTTSDATNTVIIGDKALDITQEVVDGLNAAYVKNRNAAPADED